MTSKGIGLGRRSLLTGAAGAGVAAALTTVATHAASGRADAAPEHTAAAASRRSYPPNWPATAPYGAADTRRDLWPRDDNSFVLPLEPRPQDEELGRVWIRDFYVNCFVVDGRPLYVATGTTRAAGLAAASPWNDGIWVWVAPALEGPWKLADTTGVRPGAAKGKVWSPEFADENTPGRTVVAPWQQYWYDTQFGKRGEVWAPEVHRFRGKWYIVACMGDHSQKVGSFMLVSEGGVEGPYRLIEGNADKPFGDPVAGGPAVAKAGSYFHIDGSFFAEGDDAWLVLHNDLYARFRSDMEDIVPTTGLPAFQQRSYSPEPYREGVYVFKYGGKYYLLQAVWDLASVDAYGSPHNAYTPGAAGAVKYQYDVVAAVSDTFQGPYSERWTVGVGAGHNNVFLDHHGRPWTTFFRTATSGYWADPAHVADASVPGVAQLEWTGPDGNRLYVKRRDIGHGRSQSD
ncbi:family 43 glycosylhydrolase [Actinacidiphila yeochonensis]|uniref:family 43 glycosylhydrolase n=1 Tax=Actinacidiphila yeochonensis TaxID=89050 RepID=UPI000567EF81|nr:family 43 glycosylhydrolase [Actinacidiphila yeochonensis]